MRSVIVRKPGEEAREFPTIRVASVWLGCSEPHLSKALKKGCRVNGMIVMYSNTISRGKNKKYSLNGEECLTKEEADLLMAENQEKGLKLEKVYYEKRFGAILTTICRKRERKEGKDYPLVGSVDCMQCCNFIGKNKEENYVLCAYYGKWYKESKKDCRMKNSTTNTGVCQEKTLEGLEK